MNFDYGVYIAIALTGLVSSVGGAVTEIWIKPWLKKVKRRHEAFIRRIQKKKISRFRL